MRRKWLAVPQAYLPLGKNCRPLLERHNSMWPLKSSPLKEKSQFHTQNPALYHTPFQGQKAVHITVEHNTQHLLLHLLALLRLDQQVAAQEASLVPIWDSWVEKAFDGARKGDLWAVCLP